MSHEPDAADPNEEGRLELKFSGGDEALSRFLYDAAELVNEIGAGFGSPIYVSLRQGPDSDVSADEWTAIIAAWEVNCLSPARRRRVFVSAGYVDDPPEVAPSCSLPGGAKVVHAWSLFGFLFSEVFRQRVYTPCVQELAAEYFTRIQGRSKWKRRCLALVFTVGVLHAAAGCLWQSVLTTSIDMITRRLRRWWSL